MTKSEEAPQEEATTFNEWGDDFSSEELTVPYKREQEEVKEEKVEDEQEQEELPEAPEIESSVTVEDPGDFTPKDYSFEYDIDGKKYTISTSEDIDKIPNEELEKLSAKDLTKLLRQATAIDTKLERDKESFEEKKSKYSDQVAEQERQMEVIETFAAEFDYLVSKGLIPEVPKELRDVDWSDPKVASRDGVKQQKEILDYMVKENTQRAKLGLKPLTSIVDTFNSLQMDKSRSNDEEKHKEAGEARKRAGARVAGPSSNQTSSNIPKGIAVGRTNVFRQATNWE